MPRGHIEYQSVPLRTGHFVRSYVHTENEHTEFCESTRSFIISRFLLYILSFESSLNNIKSS